MSHGRGKKEKRICCQVQFSHSSTGRGVTCRADTLEGQRAPGVAAQVCWGTTTLPQPCLYRETHGNDAFSDPWTYQAGALPLMAPHIPKGWTSTPWAQTGSPRPLWEKGTYREELEKATPQQSPKTTWLPQYATNRCPCQWLLVQDVAQLWFLKQSTACNAARSLCCNADFKYREIPLNSKTQRCRARWKMLLKISLLPWQHLKLSYCFPAVLIIIGHWVLSFPQLKNIHFLKTIFFFLAYMPFLLLFSSICMFAH